MKKITQIAAIMAAACAANANETNCVLTQRERAVALVSAYAAAGNQQGLKESLAFGLEAGVRVNEFKEILVQVYAYCGFPRSLNALNTYMNLLEERGNKDKIGKDPSPLPNSPSIKFGEKNQSKLVGGKVEGKLFEFAPTIDAFLKSHLFGDIFGRDNIDWRTRELATIAMLAAMDGVESQLESHIKIGKRNGISDSTVNEVLKLAKSCSKINVPFPIGDENTAYAQYFTGKSWLAPLSSNKELGIPIANVTFAPKCRNNWHSHTCGQILIAVGGMGYYQERGKPARLLTPGEIVEIQPNVVHWHGASPNVSFSHLAITCNPQENKNSWFEPVSDKEYADAVSE